MKRYIKSIIVVTGVIAVTTAGCKKEFFNRPPESAITIDNFYQTNEQVQASTNGLYNSPWFDWNNKAAWAITEMSGGNGRSYSSDVVNFGNFSVTNTNTQIGAAWASLFTVVAQANGLINNLPTHVPASVDKAVVNNALGEAHFMRGLAYFYIVRLWGAVPIIANSSDYVSNFQINRNNIADVYAFIVSDLKFAEANCTAMIRTGSISQGHVSSGSASAMLAKVYLYMQDYPNARTEAEKVINSGEFKLYGIDITGKTYNDLFKTANNNNEESIAALQWAGGASYGHGNSMQASLAYNSIITGTGDGYSVLGPTIDLQQAYETGDTRLHGTLMTAGDKYPEIDQATGGYTVPADVNSQGGDAAIKKYVVGTPADNGGVGAAQSAGNNTYLMRYAEVYLIEAEAILAGGASTTDATALKYFNLVRVRAGLNSLPSITQDNILHERRIEFAIEGDYWFDLGRIDGWQGILTNQHPKAIALISKQERGTYASDRVTIYSQTYTPTNDSFQFPIPATETASDPKLLLPPVAYTAKN